MPDLAIRAAEPRDVALLLNLIRELAAAEAFPFPVTVTELDLRESLFGARPAAEAVLAFIGDAPVGFAVFYETFATTTGRRGMQLDDLFVRSDYRGEGFGRALLGHVARIARKRGCARFEWWCLRTNADAIRFYRSLGARPMEELLVFRAQDDILRSL